jgi:hypothetical protein
VQPIDELTTDVTDTVSVVTALAHDGDAWWLGARLGRTPILATSPDGQRWFRRALPANVPASAQVRVVLGADRGTLLIGIADLADAATLVGPR